MAFFKAIGKLIDESGGPTMLTNSGSSRENTSTDANDLTSSDTRTNI